MATKPFVLGLDLDGVCADYEGGLRAFMMRTTGMPVWCFPPAEQWSLKTSGWFTHESAFMSHHGRAVGGGLFAGLDVLPGVREGAHQLSAAGVQIRIITHRLNVKGQHGRAAADTVDWLDRAGLPYRDLCFMASKLDVAADLYVDDAPHNIEAYQEAGRPVIIFDQLYNRHLAGPRAANWVELVPMVLKAKARGEDAAILDLPTS